MCFRPAETLLPINCPSCGKKISAIGGTYPPACPFCKGDISEAISNQNAVAGSEALMAAPGAAPVAPAAPTAPVAASRVPEVPTAE